VSRMDGIPLTNPLQYAPNVPGKLIASFKLLIDDDIIMKTTEESQCIARPPWGVSGENLDSLPQKFDHGKRLILPIACLTEPIISIDNRWKGYPLTSSFCIDFGNQVSS
jgi:hypothetical protein